VEDGERRKDVTTTTRRIFISIVIYNPTASCAERKNISNRGLRVFKISGRNILVVEYGR